jgi:hypothetical protein
MGMQGYKKPAKAIGVGMSNNTGPLMQITALFSFPTLIRSFRYADSLMDYVASVLAVELIKPVPPIARNPKVTGSGPGWG